MNYQGEEREVSSFSSQNPPLGIALGDQVGRPSWAINSGAMTSGLGVRLSVRFAALNFILRHVFLACRKTQIKCAMHLHCTLHHIKNLQNAPPSIESSAASIGQIGHPKDANLKNGRSQGHRHLPRCRFDFGRVSIRERDSSAIGISQMPIKIPNRCRFKSALNRQSASRRCR